MSSKSEEDALKELSILTLNQYVNADATGVAAPNIDSLLQDMSNKAWAKRYEESGAMHENQTVAAGMPPDVALTPFLTKRGIGEFLKKNIDKFPKRIKKYLTDVTPSQSTKDLLSFGKDEAIKDLVSIPGFERFIHTNLKATGQSFVPGFYDDYMALTKDLLILE